MPTCLYCSKTEGLTLVLVAGRTRKGYLCGEHLAMHNYTCECCGGVSHNGLRKIQYLHENGEIKIIHICVYCHEKLMPHWCPACDVRHTAPRAGAEEYDVEVSSAISQRALMIPGHTRQTVFPWSSSGIAQSHYSDEVFMDVFEGRCFSSDNAYLCWQCHQKLHREVETSTWHNCVSCGNMTRNIHPHAGYVCLGCVPGLFTCKSCGKWANQYTQTHFNARLCHECVPKHTCCRNCNEYRPITDKTFSLVYFRRTQLCTVCQPQGTFITCPDCGTLDYESGHKRMERLWRNNGDQFLSLGKSLESLYLSLPDDMKHKCGYCLAEQIGFCREGKHLIVPPNQSYRSSGGQVICATCYELAPVPKILSYSLKPVYTMYGKHPLKYGAEIECDFSRDVSAETAIKLFRSFASTREVFYKHDGSLGNGFEAVTMPMDFHYMHSHSFPKALDSVAEEYKSSFYNLSGGRSKAGLHIHMTKDAFTSLHLYKFIEFFNMHSSFVEQIAGRSANSFCQKFRGKSIDYAREKSGTEKYTIINLSHDKTIEVRIFSAATSSTNFLLKLEFLDALFNATNRLSLKEPLTPPEFRNYVESKRGIYPNLHLFLKGLS